MPRKKATVEIPEEAKAIVAVAKESSVGASELASALIAAIESTKAPTKKTASSRTPKTPWTPKDGSPKLKAKRRFFQHSLLVDPDMSTNEEIDLMNRVRPGTFLDGTVRIVRRRDKGIDIDYSIKTAAQRLRLVNQFGIRNFKELLERCILEAENPKQFAYRDED